MAPKGKTRKKKLVPVEVDYSTRWGTTKAKQASADLGRAIRNVLSEMGITDVTLDRFDVDLRAAKALHERCVANLRDTYGSDDRVTKISDQLKITVRYVESHEMELRRIAEESKVRGPMMTEFSKLSQDVVDLRNSLRDTVAVIDRIVAGQPVVNTDPPPSATGTIPHGMRIGGVRAEGGVLWVMGLGCSCGLRFDTEESMVQHLASVRRT